MTDTLGFSDNGRTSVAMGGGTLLATSLTFADGAPTLPASGTAFDVRIEDEFIHIPAAVNTGGPTYIGVIRNAYGSTAVNHPNGTAVTEVVTAYDLAQFVQLSQQALGTDTDVVLTSPSTGQVLTFNAGTGKWVNATPAAGFVNPMTTQDDIIVAGAAGVATRLAKGADGQVLTVDPTTHHLVWTAPAGGGGGMTNPMTAVDDLIVGGAAGTPTRLATIANKSLTTDGSGVIAWRSAGVGTTVAVTGQPDLSGAVELVAGAGIGLSQSGQNITISNTGSGSIAGSPIYTSPFSRSPYTSAVLADSPLVYYRFGEVAGTTTFKDYGSLGYDGTYVSGPTLGIPGASGDGDTGATMPNGLGAHSDVSPTGLPLGAAARSSEIWFKWSSASGDNLGVLMSYGAGDSGGTFPLGFGSGQDWIMEVNADNTKVGLATDGNDITWTIPAGLTTDDNHWHHFVVTYDGTNCIGYFDGVSMGSQTFPGTVNTQLAAVGNKLDFGDRNGGVGHNYPGSIDEAAIYDHVLTSAQVLAHYNAAKPSQPVTVADAPTVPYAAAVLGLKPIRYYRLDEAAVGTVTDSGSDGINATSTGPAATAGVAAPIPHSLAISLNLGGLVSASMGALPVGSASRSMAFWMKSSSANAGNYAMIVNWGDTPGNSNTYSLAIKQTGTGFELTHGGTSPIPIGHSINDNAWHHVAVVQDSTSIAIYWDGVLAATERATALTTASLYGLTFANGQAGQKWVGALDEFAIFSSLLTAEQVAYLYRCGSADGFTVNPMTTAGDLITASDGIGTPGRLAKGADSAVLTMDPATHLPVWAAQTLPATITTPVAGDILLWDAILGLWINRTGFFNPMTTLDDIIVGGASGAGTRLAKGTDGQVLTIDPATHHVVWDTPASGLTNPMTTPDDIIIGGASGTPTRLAKGSDGQVLTVDPTTHDLVWATPSGGGSGDSLVASSLLTGTAASITFSSIPTTWRELYWWAYLACDDAGSQHDTVQLQINGDTASHYHWVELLEDGGGNYNLQGTLVTFGVIGRIAAGQAPSGSFGVVEGRIPFYHTTTNRKSILGSSYCDVSDSGSKHLRASFGAEWTQTSAITSLTFTPSSGNFIAGSAIYLYGR